MTPPLQGGGRKFESCPAHLCDYMNIVEFYKTVRKLKEIKRAGWIERGIKNSESVADHSFMVTILCIAFPKQEINKEKAIKMALVHDLGESEIGDLITKEHWKHIG